VAIFCTTCLNIPEPCILPTQCICVFRMVLTITSDSFLNSVNRPIFVAETCVFPSRFELNMYTLFRGNSVFGEVVKKYVILCGEFEPSNANDTADYEAQPAGGTYCSLFFTSQSDSVEYNSDYAKCQLALSASRCVMTGRLTSYIEAAGPSFCSLRCQFRAVCCCLIDCGYWTTSDINHRPSPFPPWPCSWRPLQWSEFHHGA
jgi:hypothetical protein